MEATTVNATYPRYPAYKDSGVEWLGEIPEGWEIDRLGTLLSPKSIKGQPNLPLLSITRELGVIERDLEDEDSNHNYIPDDLSGYKVIQKGQFGMNKMKAWQGSYGVSPKTGIISPAYYVFDFTSEIDPNFFHIAIRSKSYVAFFGQASDGVRIGQWDLSKSRMKAIPFILPPLPEQTAIANFLDDKCAKIDRAIAQKEKLIALLKERKQIVIQNAVTKGLDPKVEMRDSGVEWIGEIPVGWEVIKFSKIIKKYDLGGDYNSSYMEGGMPLIKMGNIGRGKIKLGKIEYLKENKKIPMSSLLKKNDFLFNTRNSSDLVGKVCLWNEELKEATFNSNILRLVFTDKVQNQFMNYLFNSYSVISGLKLISKGTTNVSAIYFKDLTGIMLPVPPIAEQINIVDHIETQTTKIDQAITLQQTQIEKLREYKATLIDSAVRGKIKVS